MPPRALPRAGNDKPGSSRRWLTILGLVLDHTAAFTLDEPLETFLARVPAAWCVYLLADEAGRPVQLLCVKNLRASLKRRLGGEVVEEAAGPSRRIDYRGVVRQVSWTRVDSVFEQDVVYLETARRAFPESYAGVLGFGATWWLQIDAAAERPRVGRTTRPGEAAGDFFGPIPDKNAAHKLVHAVEDLFDLCRDPAALAAAPAGPCQWRQMGKCVGPCDGSVSLAGYRALVAHAAAVVADIGRAVEENQLRMRQAAASLQFEAAGQIKGFLEKLEGLRQGPFRHLRRVEDFRFLAVMPGRKRDTAKLFAITPGKIEPLMCLREAPTKGRGEEALRLALDALDGRAVLIPPESVTAPPAGEAVAPNPAERERLSLVAHHLFPTRRTPGTFIPVAALEDKSLAAAFREVNRPKQEPGGEDEGEVRGIQAL